MHEVEELNEICSFQAERTQELRDGFSPSRHEENHSDKKLRESQSLVDQLTVQIEELQDPTEYLNDARDF